MKHALAADLFVVGLLFGLLGCGRTNIRLTELQHARSGMLDIVLLSPRDALRHAQDRFVIEFRSTPDGALVDVGEVRATAEMPMPGMPMFGAIDITRTNVAGRYEVASEFSMAGTWRIKINWAGPAGSGTVELSSSVI